MLIFKNGYIYYPIYILSLLFTTLLLSTIGWLLPYKLRHNFTSLWPAFVSKPWLRLATGITVDIVGLENLPSGPFIAVANHQAQWETLYLAGLLSPVSVVMKKELLKIPFFGWAQRMSRPIAIDRDDPRVAIKTILTKGQKRIAQGLNILIFPEGTRMPSGEVGRYSKTAFKLAINSGAQVVPIVHNSGDCWQRRRFVPGTITLCIGKPIAVLDKTQKQVAEEVRIWTESTQARIKQLTVLTP